MAEVKYRRILLKISGEGLCRPGTTGIDSEQLQRIGKEIKSVADLGVELGLVIGGGNIVRGSDLASRVSIAETTAHYMGMLGTVINALAVQEVLESIGVMTRVQSAISIDSVCERVVRRRAIRHLEKGRVVVFAAGTGNPFVTTDTAAALRASEIGADVLLKATKVDGVYDSDPATNASATMYDRLSYGEVINGRLGVMDLSAIVMCEQNRIPIVVFNLKKEGNMRAVVQGEHVGTMVCENGSEGKSN
jgi:uridylate kinase